MTDKLETWLVSNYDTLAAAGQPVDSVAESEYRKALAATFEAAHISAMSAGGGDRSDIAGNTAAWFCCHIWEPGQYAELVRATGPAMSTMRLARSYVVDSPSVLRLASRLGATVSLARSPDEPLARYQALHNADTEAGALAGRVATARS